MNFALSKTNFVWYMVLTTISPFSLYYVRSYSTGDHLPYRTYKKKEEHQNIEIVFHL